MVGQAGCTDAICSAGSSTNTTDERVNAFAHPTGSYPSGRRFEACQPHRASQPSRARVADALASMVMLLDIPPPATGQQRSRPQCRAALAASATTTTSCWTRWRAGWSEGGGARSIGVSSQLTTFMSAEPRRRQEKRPSSRSLLGNGVEPPDQVRPSGGDALSCLRLALPPWMHRAARALRLAGANLDLASGS
jgi:hypothetical protein